VKEALDPWLREPRRKFKEGRVVLLYRMTSEGPPATPMRLKVEINSREHFTEHGLVHVPFDVRSDWFTGHAEITTYDLDELLGTKLRALYQRKKGRDLFDLALLLDHGADPARVIRCFERYASEEGITVARAPFEQNLEEKRADPLFAGDMAALVRPGLAWDAAVAMERVLGELVSRLPGEPWLGSGEGG
jgi:predicted nucleotidyltransferase component of viral defense system